MKQYHFKGYSCVFFVLLMSVSGCNNSYFTSSFYDHIFSKCIESRETEKRCSCIAERLEKSYTDKELKLLTTTLELELASQNSDENKELAFVKIQNMGEELGYSKVEISQMLMSFGSKSYSAEKFCKKSAG
jgi:hypothetical protein